MAIAGRLAIWPRFDMVLSSNSRSAENPGTKGLTRFSTQHGPEASPVLLGDRSHRLRKQGRLGDMT